MKTYHIRPLPFWVLTDLQPAFYDSESGTILQQQSRVYAKVQELLKTYNDFVREVNRYIEEFETGIIKDFECFKNCIIKTMTDYIESVDMKINMQDSNIAKEFEEQDSKIDEAINYMKDNIVATTTTVINEAIASGDLVVGLSYDSTTESLNIITEEGEE